MIVFKNENINYEKLDEKLKKKILSCGPFSYSVDYSKETIEINIIDKSKRYRKRYSIFNDYINLLFSRIISSFAAHKDNCEEIYGKNNSNKLPLYFLDEIHFVGLAYVQSITIVSAKEMKRAYVNERSFKGSLYYEEEQIKNEIENSYFGAFKENPFNPFRDVEIDESDLPRPVLIGKEEPIYPVTPINTAKHPTCIQLLGLFVRDKRRILICRELIEKTFKNLSKLDPWFKDESNLEKFIRLILLHEIGHSVFQYVTFKNRYMLLFPCLNETRANYFASLMDEENLSEKIYLLTKFQPMIYRYPLLEFSFELFKIGRMIYSFAEYKKYYKEIVGGLIYEL